MDDDVVLVLVVLCHRIQAYSKLLAKLAQLRAESMIAQFQAIIAELQMQLAAPRQARPEEFDLDPSEADTVHRLDWAVPSRRTPPGVLSP